MSRIRQARPEANLNQPPPTVVAGERSVGLREILERQRAELESCVGDAERRVLVARAEVEQRIEEQRRESEALIERERRQAQAQIAEIGRKLSEAEQRFEGERLESEALLERERREWQTRFADIERQLDDAHGRAAVAERTQKQRLSSRGARKAAAAELALEEAQGEATLIRDERDLLHNTLRATAQREQEMREAHNLERGALQAHVAELEGRLQTLAQRLEEAVEDHAREHAQRRELEQRLDVELASLEEARREVEGQTAAAAAQSQRLEELEAELSQAREAAARDRAACMRVEQRLDLFVQTEIDARKARERHLRELEQLTPAEAMPSAEATKRALSETRHEPERPFGPDPEPPSVAAVDSEPPSTATAHPSTAGADESSYEATPPVDFVAVELNANEPPSAPPADTRATSSARPRRVLRERWRRRAGPTCAVCRRPRPALSDLELKASGWLLTSAAPLCPACQRDGWDFPSDATVPYRRVNAPFSG
jgi:hypothetical protein